MCAPGYVRLVHAGRPRVNPSAPPIALSEQAAGRSRVARPSFGAFRVWPAVRARIAMDHYLSFARYSL